MSALTYVIPNEKLSLYLLNPAHKVVGPKAKFFLARGFSASDLLPFATALCEHAVAGWPGILTLQPWGDLHELVGTLRCPDGTTPRVLAVWKVEVGSAVASLVTAYPHR